jgi:D-arabinose 1-dehydrogenase-like Zn-dependent alcohol dehydrogenase
MLVTDKTLLKPLNFIGKASSRHHISEHPVTLFSIPLTFQFRIVGLSELQKVYDMMIAGNIAGRYVVDTSR